LFSVSLLLIAFPLESQFCYAAGYAKGRYEANRDWSVGHPTLYVYGLGRGFWNIDPSTGIPFEPIAGCVVDDWIIGRARGHNDTMHALVARYGLPKSAWLSREPGITHPFALWERRRAAGITPVPPPPVATTSPFLKYLLSSGSLAVDSMPGERDPDILYLHWIDKGEEHYLALQLSTAKPLAEEPAPPPTPPGTRSP
jgi:hypothetical protein